MTTKKERQRGSRTHGGGSHKNGRGAGNRGGRGDAGRAKHEKHNYETLGEDSRGFTRPEKTQEDVREINIQELDENAAILAASGNAQDLEDGFRIDARAIIDGGQEADIVKVLGRGQVRNRLEVIADEFTESAENKIRSSGGEVIRSSESDSADLKKANVEESGMTEDSDILEKKYQEIENSRNLDYDDLEAVLETGIKNDRLNEAYDILVQNYQNTDIGPDDVVILYELKAALGEEPEFDNSELVEILDRYFEDEADPDRIERLRYDIEGPVSPGDVAAELETIEQSWETLIEESQNEPNAVGLETDKKRYLLAVRPFIR
jgi:large subunit ribosomal protein L15